MKRVRATFTSTMRQHRWEKCMTSSTVYIILFMNLYLLVFKDSSSDKSDMGMKSTWVDSPESDQLNADMVSISIGDIMTGEPVQLPQNDQRIIKYIWDHKLLESPPPSSEKYNLKNEKANPSVGQGQFIQKILKNMKHGFFVEAGALDGETLSNTLFLEKNLEWKGLLVEGDPKNYGLVKTKNRKAWISNTCLAIKPYPQQVDFIQHFNIGKIAASDSDSKPSKSESKSSRVRAQCMPLFSLLSAINVTTVDYFSLDVEGSELQVLKTIPFDKVLIRTLSVEFTHTREGKKSLLEYMESKGYRSVGEVRKRNLHANDFIFVHHTVKYP